MSERNGKAINTGIVNHGGNNTITNSAQGKGATVINGKVVRGEKVNTKPGEKK